MNISSITKKCMAEDNPLISIVMAVYKPNLDWLKQQLTSLNDQTYPNLELLVCDDCPELPVEEKIFSECITKFSFRLFRNDHNIGSNKTFERLTVMAEGKYISYCDQDDIWHADKIEQMAQVLEKTNSPLVCSDMNVIDGNGRKIADSITKIRKRHIFSEGDGLAEKLLVSNFVTGCTMIMRSEVAKKAVPFVDSLVHDQWLAINAALCGRIEVIRRPTIDYRQHENNQTGILQGITDKKSYYCERLTKFLPRLEEYKIRLNPAETKEAVEELEILYKARIGYAKRMNFKDLRTMLRLKKYSKTSIILEIFMKIIPNWAFKKIIILAKKGVL